MDVSNVLNAVAVIVALVAAGGLGLQRSRVALLRGDLLDEQGRNKTLRQDVADLKVRDTEKTAKITQLQSDLRHAEALALRETKWADLDSHLDVHHKETLKMLGSIRQSIEQRLA